MMESMNDAIEQQSRWSFQVSGIDVYNDQTRQITRVNFLNSTK